MQNPASSSMPEPAEEPFLLPWLKMLREDMEKEERVKCMKKWLKEVRDENEKLQNENEEREDAKMGEEDERVLQMMLLEEEQEREHGKEKPMKRLKF